MFPVGVYNVEDYPLNWIDGAYYSTYKGNTFQVSSIENVKSEAEYDAVTTINLFSQTLTTDFTGTFLGKFDNLSQLRLYNNQLTVLDVSNNADLTLLFAYNNNLSSLDVSNNTLLTNLSIAVNSLSSLDLSNNALLTNLIVNNNNLSSLDVSNNVALTRIDCQVNSISSLDISNNILLERLRCDNLNSLSSLDVSNNPLITYLHCAFNDLDNLVNSQILVDLDGHGLSNGYLQSSIFGGGTLTAAGQTAKSNLLSKGWTIVGI